MLSAPSVVSVRPVRVMARASKGTTTVHAWGTCTGAPASPLARRLGNRAEGYHLHVVTQEPAEQAVADAAAAAADETVEAIETAAQENREPVVGKALDEAALKADKTVSRVGWLRALLRRLLPARGSADDTASSAS